MSVQSFVTDLAERAVRTFAQAAVAVLVADHAIGIVSVNFLHVLDVAGLAAVLSVLTSLTASKFGDDSASFVQE